ncbi:MAG: methyl-accepting chemotaxis protein [Magnetococcus sp. MYC-9]
MNQGIAQALQPTAERAIPSAGAMMGTTVFHDFQKQKFFRLRKVVPFALPLLISGPVLVTILLAYLFAANHLRELSYDTLRYGSSKVFDRVVAFLETAEYTVALNAALVAENIAETDFMTHFEAVTAAEVKHHSHFDLVYFGDVHGNHWLQKRERDGLLRMRVIQRLSDTPEARERLQEAMKLSPVQDRDPLQKLLAPVLKTVWYQKNADGKLLLHAQDPVKAYDPRLRPWYTGAMNGGKQFWTDVYAWEEKYQDQIDWQVGITVSVPVEKKGQLIGVTAIDIVLKEIADFVRTLAVSPHGRTFIFDDQGLAVALPGPGGSVTVHDDGALTRRVQRLAMDQVADPTLSAAFQEFTQIKTANRSAADDARGVVFRYKAGHEEYAGHVLRLAPRFGLNWYVAVVAPTADFGGESTRILLWSVGAALAGVVLLALLGVRLGTLLTQPINQVIQEIKRLTLNDLRPGQEPRTRIQEFGFLSFIFGKMRTSLQGMVFDISSQSNRLDGSSQDLFHSSQHMSMEIEAVRQAIRQARLLSEEVNARMVKAAARMEEMDNRMKEVLREMCIMSDNMDSLSGSSRVYSCNLEGVAAATQQAKTSLDMVGHSVQRASVGISAATRAVSEMAKDLAYIRQQCTWAARETEQGGTQASSSLLFIAHLAASLDKIRQVVGFIRDVAERVDILSLNARIEAAAAGEFGQGFAVVAHDVRELSQHMAQSAQSITSAIQELEGNFRQVNQAIQVMAAGMGNLNRYNREIMNAVATQSLTVASIDEAMQQLSQETEQIAQRMAHSMAGVSDVSGKVQQIANAIADVSRNVVKASHDVARMAPLIDQTTGNTWEIFVNVEETARASTDITSEIATVEQTIAEMESLGGQTKDRADRLAGMAAEMKEKMAIFQT